MNKYAVTMSNAVRMLLLPLMGGLGGSAIGGLGDYAYQKEYQNLNPQMSIDPVQILNSMIAGGMLGAGAGAGYGLTTGQFGQTAQQMFTNPVTARNLATAIGGGIGLGVAIPTGYAINEAAMTHADNEIKKKTMDMIENAMANKRGVPMSLQPALPNTYTGQIPRSVMPSVMPNLNMLQQGPQGFSPY